MHLIRRFVDAVYNDEPDTPFDAEPADLDQLEPDAYDQPDIGDGESK